MIQYIHISNSLDKRLDTLCRSGRKGRKGAEKCKYILGILRTHGTDTAEVYSKRTKHGEWRIGNCVKYDLGNGHRLVTVLRGNRLYIPFVGTHDETNSWLDRHKEIEFSENSINYSCERIKRNAGSQISKELFDDLHSDSLESDPYEEEIRSRLDENTLKSIFSGLYGSRKTPQSGC